MRLGLLISASALEQGGREATMLLGPSQRAKLRLRLRLKMSLETRVAVDDG